MIINGKIYRELRCQTCRKLICVEYIYAGRVAFNCPRCGEQSIFNFKHLSTKETKDTINNEFVLNSKEGGE